MSTQPPDGGLEARARAMASAAGLQIDARWWPEILHHVSVLDEQAALVARHEGSREALPAPRFTP